MDSQRGNDTGDGKDTLHQEVVIEEPMEGELEKVEGEQLLKNDYNKSTSLDNNKEMEMNQEIQYNPEMDVENCGYVPSAASESANKNTKKKRKLPIKSILRTISYFFAFIDLGLVISVFGPTLVPLANRTNVSVESMGYVFLFRALGYLIGSIVFGKLFEWVSKPNINKKLNWKYFVGYFSRLFEDRRRLRTENRTVVEATNVNLNNINDNGDYNGDDGDDDDDDDDDKDDDKDEIISIINKRNHDMKDIELEQQENNETNDFLSNKPVGNDLNEKEYHESHISHQKDIENHHQTEHSIDNTDGEDDDQLDQSPNTFQIMVMVGGMIVLTAFNTIVPFNSNYYVVLVLHFFLGFGASSLDLGANLFTVWIWGDDVNAWMQLLHFGFGVGAFLCPFLISILKIESLYIIYLSISGFSVFSMVLVIVTQVIPLQDERKQKLHEEIKKNQTENEKKEELINQIIYETTSQNPLAFLSISEGMKVSILLGFSLLGIVGAEIAFGGLINAYITEKKIGDMVMSNAVNSAFWASFTIGRLVGIPVSIWIFTPFQMLIADLLGCLISITLLIIFPTNIIVIWIGTITIGLSMASQFPTCMGLIGSSLPHLHQTSGMTSVMVILATLGEMLCPLIITSLFNAMGPYSLFLVTLASCLLAMLTYFILYFGFLKKSEHHLLKKEVMQEAQKEK